RLDQARLAEHVTVRDHVRHVAVRDATEESNPLAPLELAAHRTLARERERALAQRCERVREPDDVLPFRQRAGAEEARRTVGRRRDREALEVDAARDDLGLAARIRNLRLELTA